MLAGKLVPVEPDSKRFEIRGGGGCLCVGCIEERLGRKLRLSDFKGHTVWLLCRQHTDGWNSQRLSDAIFRFKAATKNFPPYERGLRMLRLAWSGHLIGGRTFAIVEDKEGRRDVVEISVGRPPRRRKRAR